MPSLLATAIVASQVQGEITTELMFQDESTTA